MTLDQNAVDTVMSTYINTLTNRLPVTKKILAAAYAAFFVTSEKAWKGSMCIILNERALMLNTHTAAAAKLTCSGVVPDNPPDSMFKTMSSYPNIPALQVRPNLTTGGYYCSWSSLSTTNKGAVEIVDHTIPVASYWLYLTLPLDCFPTLKLDALVFREELDNSNIPNIYWKYVDPVTFHLYPRGAHDPELFT